MSSQTLGDTGPGNWPRRVGRPGKQRQGCSVANGISTLRQEGAYGERTSHLGNQQLATVFWAEYAMAMALVMGLKSDSD